MTVSIDMAAVRTIVRRLIPGNVDSRPVEGSRPRVRTYRDNKIAKRDNPR
jgi:hypothetical protein